MIQVIHIILSRYHPIWHSSPLVSPTSRDYPTYETILVTED